MHEQYAYTEKDGCYLGRIFRYPADIVTMKCNNTLEHGRHSNYDFGKEENLQ